MRTARGAPWTHAAIVASALTLAVPATALAQLADGPYAPYRAAGAVSYFVWWMIATIALLGLAAVAAWLVPGHIAERVYQTAQREPGRTVSFGVLVMVGLPLTIFALTISLVYLPLAITTAILAVPLATAGYVTTGWLVGRALSSRREPARREPQRILWAVIGVGILRVLALVPGIDAVVVAVASTIGVGALLATFDRTGHLRERERVEGREAPRPAAPLPA